MDYWDRCAFANGVLVLALIGLATGAWFHFVSARWYAHAVAVVCIVFAAWYLVDRLLSRHVNRWMKRPGDPAD